jgi:homocysteine S-methyltransferase
MFITDGGMETDLIFHRGVELPHFASFVLLDDPDGEDMLLDYFRPYLSIARGHGVGLILDTPTWRASTDWGSKLGYDESRLERVNRRGIELLELLRAEPEGPPLVIAGAIGPRGDGYRADAIMDADQAERYHAPQVRVLADGGADLVVALTLTYPDEAVGILRAAEAVGTPAAVSFTVETDGRLPDGSTLSEAIEQVDERTDGAAAYFMVNCAHPTHIAEAVDGGDWTTRVRGVRANASRRSHAELDESDVLDEGDPAALALEVALLGELFPAVSIVGGCCGTDHRHIDAISSAWIRQRV